LYDHDPSIRGVTDVDLCAPETAEPRRWSIMGLPAIPGHVASVAVAGGPLELRFFTARFDPTSGSSGSSWNLACGWPPSP
jgi:hypothetical protein